MVEYSRRGSTTSSPHAESGLDQEWRGPGEGRGAGHAGAGRHGATEDVGELAEEERSGARSRTHRRAEEGDGEPSGRGRERIACRHSPGRDPGRRMQVVARGDLVGRGAAAVVGPGDPRVGQGRALDDEVEQDEGWDDESWAV